MAKQKPAPGGDASPGRSSRKLTSRGDGANTDRGRGAGTSAKPGRGDDGSESGADLESILEALGRSGGHDFHAYKRTTLTRRIRRRMGIHRIGHPSDYARLLREDSAEVDALARDLLISVTEFFRDPESWDHLKAEVLLPLLREQGREAGIRAWVPGCATGEEAYTLAILLLEAAEELELSPEIRIFASDIDTAALAVCRTGVYSEAVVGRVSPERLARYFTKSPEGYRVNKDVRDRLVVAEHNLLADPPFSRLDLVSCRNLLIYMVPDLQKRLLSLFHYALHRNGVLFLGHAETAGRTEALFEALSKPHRIFRKIGSTPTTRMGLWSMVGATGGPAARGSLSAEMNQDGFKSAILKQVLDRLSPPSVVVNARNQILYSFGIPEGYLEVPRGEMTADLFAWTPSQIHSQLRAVLLKARRSGGHESRGPFHAPGPRGGRTIRVEVDPLSGVPFQEKLLLVTFLAGGDGAGPEATNGDLGIEEAGLVDQLENQLREVREDLQISLEGLETSNEELRTANEEILSMNEELQSSNEELETSSEELQSLNEELARVNGRLQAKVEDLEHANNDLANLVSSNGIPTLFLDSALGVKWFTDLAGTLLGLRSADLRRPLEGLSLPQIADGVAEVAARVLESGSPEEAQVASGDGRWFLRRVVPYRVGEDRIDGVVVAFVDTTRLKHAEEALRALTERLEIRVKERTRYLEVLGRVAAIGNEADSIAAAFRQTLETMCTEFGWPVGHAYVHSKGDPATYVDSGEWWFEGPEFEPLREFGTAHRVRMGSGLLGQAAESARPAWTDDLDTVQAYPTEMLRRLGIRGAFTIPVVVGKRAAGVLKFLTREGGEPAPFLLDTAVHCGTQMGRVVERKELERTLANVVVEEHRRVGQEIHDGVAQQVAGAGFLAESLSGRIREALPEESELADRLVAALNETRQQVRDLARGLMPVEVDACGLDAALGDLVERMRATYGINCRLERQAPVRVEDNFTATHLYYVAQEALFNAFKHAQAQEVVVTIAAREKRLSLDVQDDGIGFDGESDQGMGIRIMRYRCGLIGGVLSVERAPQGGTVVRCEVQEEDE